MGRKRSRIEKRIAAGEALNRQAEELDVLMELQHEGESVDADIESLVSKLESEITDIEIDPADLRIDVYRSSGPGGQSVNTTDSAVRITHLPTGLVAACQNERSQLQNRAVAMRILKARLADLERQKRDEKMQSIRGERKAVDFGSQIRSYVLQPYQLAKDMRTGYEVGDVQRVLDGDIEGFVEAYLAQKARTTAE